MTDEECIAMAMLHGCAFYQFDYGGGVLWYARATQGDVHPVERAQAQRTNGHRCYFYTREALARFYCEFYKLLPEVTNENVSLQRDGDDQHRSRSCEPG